VRCGWLHMYAGESVILLRHLESFTSLGCSAEEQKGSEHSVLTES